jgi:hypothetical protein
MRTYEEACAESREEANAWLRRIKRKERQVARSLPKTVTPIIRTVADKDKRLNFGQDLLVLGYNTVRIENRGVTYRHNGLGCNLPRAPDSRGIYDDIKYFLEGLKAQGILVRAVFWGFGNAHSPEDKRAEKTIRDAADVFRKMDSSYQQKEAAVRVIDRIFTGKSPRDFSSDLEQLFLGRVDEKTLEGLMKDVDSAVEKVTTETGSTGVVKFESNKKRGYGKVSANKASLRNEHNALNAVGERKIVRLLAPTPIGLAETENFGALFTWGTENKELYDLQEVKDYHSLFNTLLFSYAQSRGLNLAKFKISEMQDVFNRALIHSSNIHFESTNGRPAILTLDELEQRAAGNTETLKQLREYNPVYSEASKRAGDIDSGKNVLIHGDARPENIGKDPFGVRPLVDWANAKMGSPIEDLASMEILNTGKYANWYNFVAGFRGGVMLGKTSQDLLVCHDVIQPYRTGSFKIGKGRIAEAEKDIARLRKNAQLYRDYFYAR